MKWTAKARIMSLCNSLPMGDAVYHFMQKKMGRLKIDPMRCIETQLEMAHWFRDSSVSIEGKAFFELGTGHIPTVPIGLFLCGAETVVTVDASRHLDIALLRDTLRWFTVNRVHVESMYSIIVSPAILREKLDVVRRYQDLPTEFLKKAGIVYRAPYDAAKSDIPSHSIDVCFSVNTLEHISPAVIGNILKESHRILKPQGHAMHIIDLSDHFQHQDKRISPINFLKFDDTAWGKIAGNKYAYCNRLRASDFEALFQKYGFQIVCSEKNVDAGSLNALYADFPLSQKFMAYEKRDICTTKIMIMSCL